MLSLHGKHGVVISRIPVMQNGLGDVVTRHFPDFELTYCRSLQANTGTRGVRSKSITAY